MIQLILRWSSKNKFFKHFTDRTFFIYFIISVVISIGNIILLWVFIDLLEIPTVIASTIVVAGTFLGRYILFKIFRVI